MSHLLVLTALALGGADDWPQWRHDANRSGATEAQGPGSAARLWELSLPRPNPAYDHQYRMCADAAYASVAAGGRLFLPSNVSDEVTAIALNSGAVLWRFLAEGPVRMAPVIVGDNVIFASDNGYLYAVSASDGELLWKVRGVPEDLPASRMLVNGRMSSRWPARGAPVEYEGVVYFGAGREKGDGGLFGEMDVG
ncbi:MAG: hypothetical protein EA424_06225 [Planctomycetaceae bacterium]|nr:MAG: hypothetical protein EA424_06225 [Planctomycetaceae bacterium]